MLKKAEYDEKNSYRAIKTCITRTSTVTSITSSGYHHHHSNSIGSGNFVSHNNNNGSSSNNNYHRTSGGGGGGGGGGASHRHKQGGSLQDLVEAAHRSECATTSAAAATAATQRFNCDYQLSGGGGGGGGGNSRANRRQQQHNNNNSNNQTNASLSGNKKSIKSNGNNSNSFVSSRQREGGSLPSSVNLEMDGKLKLAMGGGIVGVGDEVLVAAAMSSLAQAGGVIGVAGSSSSNSVSNSKSNRSSIGSCSSLPSQLCESAVMASAVAAMDLEQFEMDVDDGAGAMPVIQQQQQQQHEDQEVSDINDFGQIWDINLDETLWAIINHVGAQKPDPPRPAASEMQKAVRRASTPPPIPSLLLRSNNKCQLTSPLISADASTHSHRSFIFKLSNKVFVVSSS